MADQETDKGHFISLDDSGLSDEVIADFNAEADPFAALPPPDDGSHVVKLEFFEKDPEKRWKQDNGVFKSKIRAIVVDDDFKDRQLFDSMVSTKVQASTGSNRVAGIIRALGERPVGSHLGQAKQLSHLLEQSPMCKVITRWEARQAVQENGSWAEKFSLKGQKRFPPMPGAPGKFNNVVESPYDGEKITAQGAIVSYHSLS